MKKGRSTYKSETPTAISGQAIHRAAGAIKFCRYYTVTAYTYVSFQIGFPVSSFQKYTFF